jgi:PAS domain S-box-containing protein
MHTLLHWLLPDGFMPHGMCYLWRPDVLWLNVASDSVIAASYYAIPISIMYFVRRRRAVLPYWWIPALFATFIFLCGTTHILGAWVVWHPDYIVDGLVKSATAVASAGTALAVYLLLPQGMALRTPIELQQEVNAHTAELQAVNARLRQEIDARVRADAALRESEQRLRATFDHAAIGMAHVAPDGRWLMVNDRLCQIVGYPRAELLARTFADITHPEDIDKDWAQARRLLAGEIGTYSIEKRYVRRDGGFVWTLLTVALVRAADGQPLYFISTVDDISDRKRAEAALAARTDELHQTFNSTTVGLTRCSRELRYLAANPAYVQIAGVPLQQIVGRPIAEVIGQEGFETIKPYIERVLAGESVEFEVPVAFSGSGSHLLHVAYTPWRESDGSVSGWVGSIMDVTARVRAEEKLQAANQQKDQFLAMLGHELRNPLTPIRAASELLARILVSEPDAQVPLAILKRQTAQLTRLVDDLLDVSRIAQGLVKLEEEPIEIGTVVDQAVETVKPLVQEKSHRLSIRKPFSALYVRGDCVRLVQTLGNLLHNAAKYTESGGHIDLDVSEKDGSVHVSVRDSGCGIAPELLPHVFDLFVQNPQTLDRAQGGLGVGLTVVRQLVQMHHGTVTAESPGPGCGSTFTVTLPRIEAPRTHNPQVEGVSPPPQRILIVDDNADAAESLAMLLRLDGHEVSTAFSGAEALRALEQRTVDIVFLDIGLPGMDGYEVAHRIRIKYPIACPCLIALTGYGQSSDREQALAAGFAAHLTKPVDLDVLREVCRSVSAVAAAVQMANKPA